MRNKDRVAAARVALEAFVKSNYGTVGAPQLLDDDPVATVSDLIADLLHYARFYKLDPEETVRVAMMHHDAEKEFDWDEDADA